MKRAGIFGVFLLGILASAVAPLPAALQAVPGTEGASFLDIPVGAGPAALGSAYSARADDAYAPVWNPAGLGRLAAPQLAGTHQPYLETVHYEHVGYVQPLGRPGRAAGRSRRGLGLSVQYLGSGELDRRDESGRPTGHFSSYFAACSLAYGQGWRDRWFFGGAAKVITAKIADASARTVAADMGVLYKPMDRLTVGIVAANLGPDLQFVNEGDPLPSAVRGGGSYVLAPDWNMAVEGVYRRAGLASGAMGMEYRYGDHVAVRGGYNTSHTKKLSAMSGFTAGFGLFFFGQELAYAWIPFGDLGSSHYLSAVLRFGRAPRSDRSLRRKTAAGRDPDLGPLPSSESGYQNLYDLLSADEIKALQQEPAKKEKDPRP